MPMFRRTIELGVCMRRLGHLPLNPHQPSARSFRRFVPNKWQPCSPHTRPGQAGLPPTGLTGNVVSKCSNRLYFYYQLVMSSHIKERIFDNLILFTRMLHKQSNVYICLRLRRFGQICNLYRRIYSPRDFKNLIVDQFLERLKHFATILRHRSSRFNGILARNRVLLSFAALGAFSWEENRISDQELQELMDEFMYVENYQEKVSNSEDQNESSFCKQDQNNADKSQPNMDVKSEGSSFMVVNCLQATQKSPDNWEEVINQPNFHVWRKSVNNTSLYEYKVFGSFFDISAYSFYSVQRDLEFRKQWDKLVLKLDIIEMEPECMHPRTSSGVDDSGNELVHWVMKYPYPMKSREYLFLRRSRIDHEKNFIVTVSRSVPYPNIPESDEHVRVYEYMSQMVIRPHSENFYDFGFDYMLTYFDDPRASFPSPAYNWMASRGVPDFVEKLHQAALKLSSLKDFATSESKKNSTLARDPQEGDEATDVDALINSTTVQRSKLEATDLCQATSSPVSGDEDNKSGQQPPSNSLLSPGSSTTPASIDRNRKSNSNKNNNKETNNSTFSFKSLNIWN